MGLGLGFVIAYLNSNCLHPVEANGIGLINNVHLQDLWKWNFDRFCSSKTAPVKHIFEERIEFQIPFCEKRD